MDISTKSQSAIRWMLGEIDETNFHVCGNSWRFLYDLCDAPGTCFGDLVAWACVAGIVNEHPALDQGDTSTILMNFDAHNRVRDGSWDIAEQVCLDVLGVTDLFYADFLENKPVDRVKCVLRGILELNEACEGQGCN